MGVMEIQRRAGKPAAVRRRKKDATEYCSHRESGKAIRRSGSVKSSESGHQRGRSFRAAGTEWIGKDNGNQLYAVFAEI